MAKNRTRQVTSVVLQTEDREATSAERQARDPELAELGEVVQEAVAFSSKWPQEFRVAVFEMAARQLLESRRLTVREPTLRHATTTIDQPFSGTPSAPMERLSRALGVALEEVIRIVAVVEDGKITVMGHLDGRSKKELQRGYSSVYAFIKEKAVGVLQVDAEELRTLCVDHGCYDMANFAANLRWKGFMREIGGKGAKDRRYVASKGALFQGETLLRGMIDS